MARAATIIAVWIVALAATAAAGPLTELGDAYRDYDAGDLAAAQAALGRFDASELSGAHQGPPGHARPAPEPARRAIAIQDYALWLHGMIALRTGDPAAESWFRKLAQFAAHNPTPFARELPWRLADAAWARGDRKAASAGYEQALAKDAASGDAGTAMFRIAETRTGAAAAAAYRAFAVAHPAHPLAARAEQKLVELASPPLTAAERIERAKHLTDAHLWDEAVAELSLVDAPELRPQRDYWLGTTLFKMRRRYGDAGVLLLGAYPALGGSAPEAMFHGARALSRADRDDDAIHWYQKVVADYPSTLYAQEAQFLTGWLEFNRGHYEAALRPLETSLARYPRGKWADDSLWFLAMSHYLLGHWDQAKARLTQLAGHPGAAEGGKGSYWLARIAERQADPTTATAAYTQIVTRFPFSWYALLSRARLANLGHPVPPFGTQAAPRGPRLAAEADGALASDELIRRADQLITAGLGVEAGNELMRAEGAFLHRHDRAAALAMLIDRYRKAGNFYRPWMLAVSYSGDALNGPADGDAHRWWENAYPRAFRELIEQHQALGKNPDGYLYSIMRIESGFNPHDLSYADAQGLLQMIPPTTMKVAHQLGIPYDEGQLYEPAYNIQTGSWYIGHLLQKFKGQIPIGAGSFNCGPRPVMKWLDQWGDREIDELVELVPYTQTRDYMKKVAENFARYQYLYQGVIYDQPLTVDKHYLDDRLTY